MAFAGESTIMPNAFTYKIGAPHLAAMTDNNYLSLPTIDIKPGETKYVSMLLTNAKEVKAVQGNIKLPSGLSFVTKSNGRLDVSNVNSRSEDFTLSCALQDDGSMTFAHYSADGFAYDGNEGGIFTFKIKADENAAPGGYEVKLSEMVLSIEGVAYEQEDRTSVVNIIGAPEEPSQWEITLWEGEALVAGWENQPYFLADGGDDLKANNAQAGDIIRFYGSAPDDNWQVELTEGHWKGMYERFSAKPLFWENGDPWVSTIVDLAGQGYFEFTLTDEVLAAALKSGGWGGVFLLNGDGNLTITKVTLVKEGEAPAEEPQGEEEDIIDKFTYCWNAAETVTPNADDTLTYVTASWGGLAGWFAPEDVPSDWSMYEKVVFEFAEPTTVNTQILVGGTNASAWGNPGIRKLQCVFGDNDMTAVTQCVLQTSAPTTIVVTRIYLVKKADPTGVEKVELTKNVNAPIYNLAGQQVSKAVKGVYIQNGKKFIVK